MTEKLVFHEADDSPLQVECRRSGSRLIPVRFGPTGREHEVAELLDWWPGADHSYVKLRTRGRALYILRHDELRDEWEVKLLASSAEGAR